MIGSHFISIHLDKKHFVSLDLKEVGNIQKIQWKKVKSGWCFLKKHGQKYVVAMKPQKWVQDKKLTTILMELQPKIISSDRLKNLDKKVNYGNTSKRQIKITGLSHVKLILMSVAIQKPFLNLVFAIFIHTPFSEQWQWN